MLLFHFFVFDWGDLFKMGGKNRSLVTYRLINRVFGLDLLTKEIDRRPPDMG